jgi:two-component system LytT family response regulator
VILKTAEIDWVEAAGVYVELHAGRRSACTARASPILRPNWVPGFVRIHRSTLVNLDRIRELTPATHGEFRAVLTDGTELKVSRGYRHRLEEHLGQSL